MLSIVVSCVVVATLIAGLVYRVVLRYRRRRLLKVLETTEIYEAPNSPTMKISPDEQTRTSRGISEDIIEAEHISDADDSIDRDDFIKNVFAVEQDRAPRRRKAKKLVTPS